MVHGSIRRFTEAPMARLFCATLVPGAAVCGAALGTSDGYEVPQTADCVTGCTAAATCHSIRDTLYVGGCEQDANAGGHSGAARA